ncbi:MAG: hypothetical protein QXU54_01300 [Candidatus Micrarchaeia archaeon]
MLAHRVYLALLSLCVLAGVTYSSVPEGHSLLHNKTLVVPADVEWVGSGLNLSAGDYIIISAWGRWGYDPRPQFVKGPDGPAEGPGLQQGRLSAKIGDGAEFAVGSYYEGTCAGDGMLMLHMYDTTQRRDNVGNVSVNVLVYSNKAAAMPAANTTQKNQTAAPANDRKPAEDTADKQTERELCTVGIVLLMGALTLYVHQKQRANLGAVK